MSDKGNIIEVPSGEPLEIVQIPKNIFEDLVGDYQRLKLDEFNNLHPEAGLPPRPPDIAYNIKLEDIPEQPRATSEPLPVIETVPKQGTIAPRVIHTIDELAKVPHEMHGLYRDQQGNLIPEWMQVARMFHRPHKKVAIVGFADTREQAPFNDPTFEIWGLNDLHNWLPRYDRWFDIHTRDNIDEDVRLGRSPPGKCGLSGLANVNAPVYMQDRYPDVPNSIRFPLKEMVEKYGNYFTNSISYMIALAIFEGYEEMHIYGVDMAVGTEYVKQRPSVEYFIGIAKGAGIKVYIPPASDLCKTRFLYAYESRMQDAFNDKIKNMLAHMNERMGQITQQENAMRDQRNQYSGAIGATNEIYKIWSNLHDKDVVINDN